MLLLAFDKFFRIVFTVRFFCGKIKWVLGNFWGRNFCKNYERFCTRFTLIRLRCVK